MAYGPKPLSRCREVTIRCKVNGHTRESNFKVWERSGLSGEDPQLNVLYDGDSWAQAYAALTGATEVIEDGLR